MPALFSNFLGWVAYFYILEQTFLFEMNKFENLISQAGLICNYFFIDFLWVKRFSLVELLSPKMPVWPLCVDQADTSSSTKGTNF